MSATSLAAAETVNASRGPHSASRYTAQASHSSPWISSPPGLSRSSCAGQDMG